MTTALIDGDRKSRRGRNKYTADSFITDTHKACSWCDEIKLHSEFHKDKRNIHGKGLSYYCKACATAKTRAHHLEYKNDTDYQERKKSSYYKRTYGISYEEREELLNKQNYKCLICAESLNKDGGLTHTDHCHTTGKVRGLLCTNCNRGLGHFKDSVLNLKSAISYLENNT